MVSQRQVLGEEGEGTREVPRRRREAASEKEARKTKDKETSGIKPAVKHGSYEETRAGDAFATAQVSELEDKVEKLRLQVVKMFNRCWSRSIQTH